MAFVPSASAHYDLIVIGSGPAAQKCAVDSAKRGKKVVLVDKKAMYGGVCVHTGTIPSKTFREAIIHLTGYRHQGFYGKSSLNRIGVEEILQRVHKVEDSETDVVLNQLRRNNVEIITGTARFIEPDEYGRTQVVVVKSSENISFLPTSPQRHFSTGSTKAVLTGDKFLIACGTRPHRKPGIPFDGERVFDSDQLLWGGVKDIPRNLIVMGAGVIGMEYASMINVVPGTQVAVIDPRPKILSFADKEVVESLMHSMRVHGCRFLLGETVERVEVSNNRVIVHLASGKKTAGDALLYAMGRQGNTDTLNLEAVGVEADDRGCLAVNNYYQTKAPHIYAAGDVVGYPSLASTSMEQGRRASLHMWSSDAEFAGTAKNVKPVLQNGVLGRETESLFPYGIYTIPEVSMIGKSEQQLSDAKISYEVGIAHYSELAKGQMLGGMDGFLKIIFSTENMQILGVHAIGEGATEIVHIGQVIMSQGGTIEYFRNAVFNYPTLAEAYNVAAHNGLQKLGLL